MIKVLIVGQIPPPNGGQAIMIERLLNGEYANVKLFHVAMSFSKTSDEIGQFSIFKMFHLIKIIFLMIYKRLRYNIKVLYYPPAGPNITPMIRDIILLGSTRWLFKHTIFHFHAGGISELYPQLAVPFQAMFRLAYFHADVGIRLAEQNPPDSHQLQLKKDIILPNGIEDIAPSYQHLIIERTSSIKYPEILFVGMIQETKGVLELLECCGILKTRGLSFCVNFVGGVSSKTIKISIDEIIEKYDLDDFVKFSGVLTGNEKWEAYARANVFCFPTYFEAETFGLVALEAMQFSLPVVATLWRGVPSLVIDGETGFLVPIKQSVALANKLEILLSNPDLAIKMGKHGRKRYLQNYTIEVFYKKIEDVFHEVVQY